MMSWHPAFPGVTQCVTSNSFCHFNFVLICDVVGISSCHAPKSPLTLVTWFIFLQSFTFSMKHSQACKYCIFSNAQNTTNTLLLVDSYILLQVSSPTGHRIFQGPACFFPALCDQLAKIAAVGFRCAHCSSKFDTWHTMDCHHQKKSSLGTGSSYPSNTEQVSIFYWKCHCFIVHCSGTWISRCTPQPHRGSLCT